MALIDLKSDLSQISKPFDNSKQHEPPRDKNDSNLDIDNIPTREVGIPLTQMVSKYAPGDGNLNNSQIGLDGGRHWPKDPDDHSLLNLDGTPFLGNESPHMMGIPNSANAYGSGPLYSHPPDAPTWLHLDNPYPISTGLVDYFSGRKGEWGDGTLPLGFTDYMSDSKLILNIAEPIITPLSWQTNPVESSHPFGNSDEYSFDITNTPGYVSELQLGTQQDPLLYPIDINTVSPLIPNDSTLHNIINPSSYSDISFTFSNTPAIDDSGEYIPTPYTNTNVTPSGFYGDQTEPPNPPSTHPSVNSQFGISYGEYNFDSISALATRYRDIHTAGNDTNLYPYPDIYAGVEDTETSLFTITNPTTYLDSLTFTFSNTSAIQDGNYMLSHYNELFMEPTQNYGSSLLLTGGVQNIMPRYIGAVNSNGGISYGAYGFNTISELAIRYNNIHIPGDATNLYPYSDQNTGIFELTTGLHSITQPNNNEFYVQPIVSYDWTTPSYGGDNTSGEPPFDAWTSKMKAKFDTDGTSRYQIKIPTDTSRYTFPDITFTDTDYKFDTQFGYNFSDAYDNIYEKKVFFRVADDIESSPLGNYIKAGAWSETAETINNYGYHSRLNIPKEYLESGAGNNYSFDSISDLAVRYKGIHIPYNDLNLYAYSNASQSLSSQDTTIGRTLNAITVTPSHTFPVIPAAEGGQNMTIGPFNLSTTNYTGDGNYTWPVGFVEASSSYTKFSTFFTDDSVKNNYGFQSLFSIPTLTGDGHGETYKFDKISDLAIRYKGETAKIPGRVADGDDYDIDGSKSSFRYSKIKDQYKQMSGYRFSTSNMEKTFGKYVQGWWSGTHMYTGDGTDGPMRLDQNTAYKEFYQAGGSISAAGSALAIAAGTFADVSNKVRFLGSPNGIIWMGGQAILQRLNQRPETRGFNPLSMAFSLVPTQHRRRHHMVTAPKDATGDGTYMGTDEITNSIGTTYSNTNVKKHNRLIVLWGNRIAVAAPSNNQNNQNQSSAAAAKKTFKERMAQVGEWLGDQMQTLRGGPVVGKNVVNSNEISTNTLNDKATTVQEYRLPTYHEIQQKAAGEKSNYSTFMKETWNTHRKWINNKMGEQGTVGLERIGYDDDGNYIIKYTNDNSGVTDHLNKQKIISSSAEAATSTELSQFDNQDFVRFRIHWKSKLDPMTGKQDGTIKTRIMVFRCVIDGFTDNFSTDYGSTRYVGRPDKVHVYQGMERKISFNLTMHPMSRVELKPMYDKLNALVGLTSPDFDRVDKSTDPIGERMVAPICRMTLGNYLEDCPVIIESVNLTFDDKGTWEIDKGMQVPRYIKAALSMIYIGDEVPRMGHKYFATKGFTDDENAKKITGHASLKKTR